MLKKILSVFVGIVLVTSAGGAVLVSAQSDNKNTKEAKNLDQTGLTPQPYNSDVRLKTGTVIQIDEKDSTKVISATQDKMEKAFGVIATANNLPIAISSNAGANQVFVATNGSQTALVTNENGPIEAGDSVALSSLSGALMKATYKQHILFGKALASFDGKNNTIGTTTLKDTDGNAHKQIGIGTIPVSIEISNNPAPIAPIAINIRVSMLTSPTYSVIITLIINIP